MRASLCLVVLPIALSLYLGCSSSSSDDSSAQATSDSGASDSPFDGNSASNDAGADASTGFLSVTELGRGAGIVVDKVSYLSDGLVVVAQICRPDDALAHPLILFNHGGFVGLTTEIFQTTSDTGFCVSAAKNGYVIAEASYRGEDGSEGKVEVCLGEVDDVIALLAILRTQPYVAPAHIAVFGGSHGGCITDQVALREPTLQSAVDFYGPTDWATLDQLWHDKITQNEPDPWCASGDGGVSPCLAVHRDLIAIVEGATGGTPAQVPAAYAARSTATKIGGIAVPILIAQGTDDALVDLSQGCTKRAAFTSIDSFYFDTAITLQNPSTVCSGNYLTTGLPNGQAKTDWPDAAYFFALQGQGHGFTGPLGDKMNTLALQFLIAKM